MAIGRITSQHNIGAGQQISGTLKGSPVENRQVLAGGADYIDPFEDDTPMACGIEDPDQCESCT